MAIDRRTSATARFRATRLLADDLRKLEGELNVEEITWRIGASEKMSTWTWKTVYTKSTSLDELIDIAPKGLIGNLQVDAEAAGGHFALSVPGPTRRFIKLTYEGSGEEVPESFWNVSRVLKAAEKRGEKWHYAGAAVGPAVAICVPLLILDQVARLGWFYNETRPVQDENVGPAIWWSFASFMVLTFIAAGFWGWSTSSGVTLRPIIDTGSLVNRTINSLIGAGKWIWSAHKAEDLNKQIMLLATVIAAICGAGSFVVALLK